MNDHELQLQLLRAAALLHDIGKFCQRAGKQKSSDQADMYCPTGNHGQPTHQHVLYTDHFIEKQLPLPPELEQHRSRLARLAASHHKPAGDNLEEQALCIADRLSAGSDRKQGEEADGDYKSARLLSIFEQVDLQKERTFDELSQGRYHRLEPLSEATAPVTLDDARQTGYEELFTQFSQKLQKLPRDLGTSTYLDALTSLLEEFTWCVPSSTYKSLPDISLYDHAVTTTALAQALFIHASDTGIAPGQQADTAKKFLFVGGDLSGIQNYIFGLDKSHGSGVAKLFRARSFYLQALTRGVILALCERLGLSPLARVMDAGGRFLLLVPALDSSKKTLADFEQELQQQMFERFRGQLSLNLDWSVELTERDFDMKHLRHFLDQANDALEARKLRKFDRLFANGIRPVIELDYAAYQDHGDCAVCHARPADSEASEQLRREQGREITICADCAGQIQLIGKRLPDCRYLVFDRREGQRTIPLLFGYHLRLEKELKPERDAQAAELVAIRDRGVCAFQPIAAHLPRITQKDLERWQAWGELQKNPEGQTCFGEDPAEKDAPKTFEMLARDSRREDGHGQPAGRSFLGAFKADVDNLGLIFSIGLHDRLSLSRFASLSRMLNHFFSEELVRWIKQDWPNLYIIFAGGDDLFLLGPWTELVRFADQLNQRFLNWVANRPGITLSAGITVNRPGLPVHRIAATVEEALENSKHHSSNGQTVKNAVTLFDTTVDWDDFVELRNRGQRLLSWIERGIISHGLVARLLRYGDKARAFHAGKVEAGIYIAHMRYDFARNLKEEQLTDPDARAEILGLPQNRFVLENIRLPVSYALYQTRFDH